MPLFDYVCSTCGERREAFVRRYDDAVVCRDGDVMQRQLAAPSFKMTGFCQMTGYASEQVRIQRKNGVRIETRGNFEAFDKLTNS